MSDWQQVALGEICSIEIGGTPSRSEPRYWWKSDKDGIRLPWVSISDMKGKVITVTKESITEMGALQSNCKHVPKGTLLMSFKLTIGRLAFAGRDLYTNEAISAIKPLKDIHPEFLYYGLQHWNLTGDSDQAVKGVTLNKQKLQEIPCLLPPLPEQKKIAEILSGIDNLIASKERQISALKNLQKSLLDALVEDQVGSGIPCVELNDVISPDRKITYGIVQAGPHTPGGIPYIRVTDMSRDQLEPNEMLRTTEELAAKFKRSEVKEGDVVLALRGIIGASHLIDKRAAGCNLTQGTALLSRSEKCDPCYLNTILKSEYCRRQFAQLSKGSTIVEITLSTLGTIKIPLPERVEQERTARIIDTMQSQIRHGNEMLSSYKNLKVAISSDLLSGRKRVTL